MAVAAPVITAEMEKWKSLGGSNLGIVGNAAHGYGFHRAANEVPASDYSRRHDPNGSDGPYVNWDYACAGDFGHERKPNLLTYHRDLLARLMRGELPMICEFIGQPWDDRPVYYWARWNGVGTLQKYTGSGHDRWSHVSWYRSRVDEPAGLWVPNAVPGKVRKMFAIAGQLPSLARGDRDPVVSGTYYVTRVQKLLDEFYHGNVDGDYGPLMQSAVKAYNAKYLHRNVDGRTIDAAFWKRLYAF
jgi:hypothetical protein